jgi:hypothetical protein
MCSVSQFEVRALDSSADESFHAVCVTVGALSESRDSSARNGRSGFDSRQRQEIFLFYTASTEAEGNMQSSILTPGVKRPECEADYSPPSSAYVKNYGAIPAHPHTSPCRGA